MSHEIYPPRGHIQAEHHQGVQQILLQLLVMKGQGLQLGIGHGVQPL